MDRPLFSLDFRTPGPDRANAFRDSVVDRQRIKHPTLVADNARMHHLEQRLTYFFGRNRSGLLLLLDEAEQLQVARSASARERTRGRSMRHNTRDDGCEHPWCWAEYP